GLHMGLIYVILCYITGVFSFLKRKPVINLFVILTCLWVFAFITGSPPSAMRSAVMFSFIITGKTFFRQHSVYNAICSSAFFLLCFNPYLLWDVGFRLSYLAVIGIIWLQQPVYR